MRPRLVVSFVCIVAPLLLGGTLSPGSAWENPHTRLWSCTAECLAPGRKDGGFGGQCFVKTVVLENRPSEKVCRDEMKDICDKVPPPPGGCVQQ